LGHGARKADATWTNSGQWAFFWTTTEEDGVPEKAWDFLLRYDFGSNQNWTTEKGRGLAVRCIKDAAE